MAALSIKSQKDQYIKLQQKLWVRKVGMAGLTGIVILMDQL